MAASLILQVPYPQHFLDWLISCEADAAVFVACFCCLLLELTLQLLLVILPLSSLPPFCHLSFDILQPFSHERYLA